MPALLLPLSKLAQGASRPFDGPPPREGEIAGSFWAASWHKNPPVKSRRPAHAVRNPWYRAQPKPSDHSLDLTAPHNLLSLRSLVKRDHCSEAFRRSVCPLPVCHGPGSASTSRPRGADFYADGSPVRLMSGACKPDH